MASTVTNKPASAASDPTIVDIEKLVYGGEGLARIEGQIVLIPFVLPSEKVTASTKHVKNGLLRGKAIKVLEAASQRVTPRCEYFMECGGCHYQHAEYSFQVEQKREILRETLRRLAKIDYAGEIEVVTGEPWFYRNRVQIHFRDGEAGFHRMGSHVVKAVDHCYIASPILVDTIGQLAQAIKRPEWPSFLQSIELFTNETDLQLNILDSKRPVAARFFEWCKTFLPRLAQGAIEYRAIGRQFRISHGSFFQVNRFLIDALVSEVVGQTSGRHAVDLYAGVGLFSLPLAQRFKQVDAVERGGQAFRDLEWNARRNGAANLEAAHASAEDFLRDLKETPDLVVADPPRAGLGKEVVGELLRLNPPNLTIVSCEPATLARDLQMLLTRFRITRLALVDLFPQTYHLETVAHLERLAA